MDETAGICYVCKKPGHWAAACPDNTPAEAVAKPPWCETCDPHTRLLDLGHAMARCPRCHPLSWKPLPHHKRCGGCRRTVYEWDQMPCEHHLELLGSVYRNR